MKKLYKLITIIVCIVSMALMTACVPVLSGPNGFWFNRDTQEIVWNKVENAKSYTIDINGKQTTTRQNAFSIEDLDPGEYTVKVKANGDDEGFKDSDWVEYTVERDPESGLLYKLINNNSEYQLVGVGKVAAGGKVVMESEYRGKPVTQIGDAAIRNGRISSIVIAKTVKSIGKRAFMGCTQLETIVFEEGSVLESIGTSAFQNCRELKEVNIPDTVTTVGELAFAYCFALEKANISKGQTEVPLRMFANCSSLTEITGPETILAIQDHAFSACSKLAKINGFKNVKKIGGFAFMGCASLTNIPVFEYLESIGDQSFRQCTTLNNVVLSDSVTSIEQGAFFECEALDTIKLGNGVMKVGRLAFGSTKIWNDAVDVVYVDNWVVGNKNVEIESVDFKEGTAGIADEVFLENAKLRKVYLPSVRAIGDAAFAGATMLWSVILGDSLKSIGDQSFWYCEGLTELTLGTSLETIGDYAFYGCKNLNSTDKNPIQLPDTVKSIGAWAFNETIFYKQYADDIVYLGNWVVGCKNPILGAEEGKDIPSVKEGTIGLADYSFSECMFMTQLGLPDSLEYIGEATFSGCMFLQIVNMPASLKRIGDYAFYNSSVSFGDVDPDAEMLPLTAIFPEGLEYIGRSAFYGCINLLKVDIPGTVKTIGDYAFFGCAKIGGFTAINPETGVETKYEGYLKLGEGIETIGSRAFYGCGMENTDKNIELNNEKDVGIKELVIPNSVTSIGSKAFYGCAMIKNLTISNAIDTIEEYAFYGCSSVEKIVIPASVKSIAKYAFRGCSSATELVFEGQAVEYIGDYAFFACSSLSVVNIPKSVNALGNYVFAKGGIASSTIGNTLYNNGKHTYYGNNNATIYMEYEEIPKDWEKYWNSSYRPVILGCTLSEDGSYVVSFTKNANTILNDGALNGINAPARSGYTFGGWTTKEGSNDPKDSEFTANEILDIENGITVYAIWIPNN